MNEIIKELDSAIQEFDKLKHKYPRMKTQDVIDLLRRLKGKIEDEAAEDDIALCEVHGCNEPVSNMGIAWAETGYWAACSEHLRAYRFGYPLPRMKKGAIEREERRENGLLPAAQPH